jgi:hypothetical protein
MLNSSHNIVLVLTVPEKVLGSQKVYDSLELLLLLLLASVRLEISS